MRILHRQQIENLLSIPDMLEAVEQGFAAFSRGEAIVPPVVALQFDNPIGDCHIKYGYLKKGKYYVVKIASGFPDNPQIGLPAGNGLMLLFDKNTGAPAAILLDEGYLTDMRTAAGGAIAAKHLAPKNVSCIGIVGTGAQAYYQLKLLSFATQCRQVLIWGRNSSKAALLKNHPDFSDWKIQTTNSLEHLTANCNLIVTTTSSHSPLLFARQIQPGTHITAVGADDAGKQELDSELIARADQVIVDSRSQCLRFGNVSHAIKEKKIFPEKIRELGEVVIDSALGRTSDSQITIADLTGIAVQDLQIATTVFEKAIGNCGFV